MGGRTTRGRSLLHSVGWMCLAARNDLVHDIVYSSDIKQCPLSGALQCDHHMSGHEGAAVVHMCLVCFRVQCECVALLSMVWHPAILAICWVCVWPLSAAVCGPSERRGGSQ